MDVTSILSKDHATTARYFAGYVDSLRRHIDHQKRDVKRLHDGLSIFDPAQAMELCEKVEKVQH